MDGHGDSPRVPRGGVASEPRRSSELVVEDAQGRRALFDLDHAAASVVRALERAGEPDAGFAQEVARVIEMCLVQRGAAGDAGAASGSPPHSRGSVPAGLVEELIERALVELGRAAAAKAYILERSERRRLGEVLHLQSAPDARSAGAAPEVFERQRSAPWSRARIAAALVTEADLAREAAEDVARRVEQRVLALGQKRITTGLIRELVDGELVALGMHGALRRQEAVKLPRHDLRELLAGRGERGAADAPGTPAARGFADEVAAALLARYVREDVLGARAQELLGQRELAIADAGSAHLPLALVLPCELVAGGAGGSGGLAGGGGTGGDARSAFALLGELAPALGACGRSLELEGAGAILAGLSRGAREGSPLGLEAWLRALAALARASRRQIVLGRLELAGAATHHQALCARLVQVLAEHVPPACGTPPLLLALDDGELDALLGAAPERADDVEALLERGVLELRYHAGGAAGAVSAGPAGPAGSAGFVPGVFAGARLAGLGCLRLPRERGALACSAAVGIDLEPSAARAGAFREDPFLEQLAERVQVALEALRALERFQRLHQIARPLPARARGTWMLVPLELRAALKAQGAGSVDPAQAARWLAFLSEAARRFARPGDAPVLVDPEAAELFERAGHAATLGGGAGGALARRSAESALDQQLLFAEASAPAPRRGNGLGPVPGWWPLEAEGRAAAALGAGRLPRFSEPELAQADALGRYFALEAWRRFRAARARARAPGRASTPGLFVSERTPALPTTHAADTPGSGESL